MSTEAEAIELKALMAFNAMQGKTMDLPEVQEADESMAKRMRELGYTELTPELHKALTRK